MDCSARTVMRTRRMTAIDDTHCSCREAPCCSPQLPTTLPSRSRKDRRTPLTTKLLTNAFYIQSPPRLHTTTL